MKRLLGLAVVVGLVGGYLASPSALAGKKLVAKTSKLYLRDDNGCDDPNYLSKKNGPDSGCWQLDSFLNEPIINQAGLLNRDQIAQHWEARDGVPLVLNAKKNISGTIATYSGSCVDSTVPCSPAGIGAGRAEVDIIVRGWIGGTEVVLGEQNAAFTVVPGGPNETEVDLDLPDALHKKKVTALRVTVYFHGAAVFHSGVEMDNPASFINMPTLVKKR